MTQKSNGLQSMMNFIITKDLLDDLPLIIVCFLLNTLITSYLLYLFYYFLYYDRQGQYIC